MTPDPPGRPVSNLEALGLAGAMKGGVGTWAVREGATIVGALVVVNAFGDVRDARGEIVAGARGPDGRFIDAVRYLAEGHAPFGGAAAASPNTTLTVLATNAALTKTELRELAWAGSDAVARRITPYGTAFDGDVIFAASTAEHTAASPLQAEALAALCVSEAVERAVRLAHGTPGVPASPTAGDRPAAGGGCHGAQHATPLRYFGACDSSCSTSTAHSFRPTARGVARSAAR